ncbi:hypothetical protein TW95_gp1796 [Pandoravirus inopinatum]|uniref:Uncharacterized protein n=1 Tax=Pandoravirus inopinatum TaxID=1605721 RepID=A0A0B5J975_9VIRU|nr:hypothetical protein TW95_gp1796 [Pandoravirus inopinatum]AJF98530.1 hypothetical protein [Pandoravirus inopinatum]
MSSCVASHPKKKTFHVFLFVRVFIFVARNQHSPHFFVVLVATAKTLQQHLACCGLSPSQPHKAHDRAPAPGQQEMRPHTKAKPNYLSPSPHPPFYFFAPINCGSFARKRIQWRLAKAPYHGIFSCLFFKQVKKATRRKDAQGRTGDASENAKTKKTRQMIFWVFIFFCCAWA